MLDKATSSQLAQHLLLIRHPIRIAMAIGDDEASSALRHFLAAIADLHPAILLTEEDHERRPSFAIRREGVNAGIRFAAIPQGRQLTSFVLALLQAGGHGPLIDDETRATILAIGEDLHFTTYFARSCGTCPETVQTLNAISAINPKIRHTAVDGGLFREEVDALRIAYVPAVYLNGVHFMQGRASTAAVLAQLSSRFSNVHRP